MCNYTTSLDFSIDSNNIKELQNYILKSNYSNDFTKSKIHKSLIIKFSLYITLIFLLLLSLKLYLFMDVSISFSIHDFLYTMTILIEFFLKVLVIFIFSIFLLIYLNRINNCHLISTESQKLNLFIGDNTFYLNKSSVEITNNKTSLSIPFSDIDNISLYKEYVFISNNRKLLCIIKCTDKTIRNDLTISLEQGLNKQILIKEV